MSYHLYLIVSTSNCVFVGRAFQYDVLIIVIIIVSLGIAALIDIIITSAFYLVLDPRKTMMEANSQG